MPNCDCQLTSRHAASLLCPWTEIGWIFNAVWGTNISTRAKQDTKLVHSSPYFHTAQMSHLLSWTKCFLEQVNTARQNESEGCFSLARRKIYQHWNQMNCRVYSIHRLRQWWSYDGLLCLSESLISEHIDTLQLHSWPRLTPLPVPDGLCGNAAVILLYPLHSPAYANTSPLCKVWQPYSPTGDNQSPPTICIFSLYAFLSPSNWRACVLECCVHYCHSAISQHPFIASPMERFWSMPWIMDGQSC